MDRLVPGSRPLSEIVDFSSAFSFETSEALARTHQSKFNRVRYGRDSGLGSIELEAVLERWHPGFRVLTFRSGMAALNTILNWGFRSFETIWVQAETYRKTRELIRELEEFTAKKSREIPIGPSAAWPVSTASAKDSFVILEIPSNPHLRLPDWPRILEGESGKPFILVDATLSGLGNLSNELIQHSDAIVYSLTKYIGGHNDLIGGAAFVRPERFQDLWSARSREGNIIGPVEAFLALRSLKTFDLRWQRQCDGAEEVFELLGNMLSNGILRTLNYPGEGTNRDQKDLVARTLARKGAVMSFAVDSDRRSLAARISNLRRVKMAPSFGSTDSLIEICSLMSQPDATDQELTESGLEPNLVRLSVGLEEPKDIVSDLQQLFS